jgi:phosphatidylinositol kinase/protein kinase (PI-3  family)
MDSGLLGLKVSPLKLLGYHSHDPLGVFRIACEITMQVLHDNRDCLMSVLDAFVHDPLIEWEDEKRRLASVHLLSSAHHLTGRLFFRIETLEKRTFPVKL